MHRFGPFLSREVSRHAKFFQRESETFAIGAMVGRPGGVWVVPVGRRRFGGGARAGVAAGDGCVLPVDARADRRGGGGPAADHRGGGAGGRGVRRAGERRARGVGGLRRAGRGGRSQRRDHADQVGLSAELLEGRPAVRGAARPPRRSLRQVPSGREEAPRRRRRDAHRDGVRGAAEAGRGRRHADGRVVCDPRGRAQRPVRGGRPVAGRDRAGGAPVGVVGVDGGVRGGVHASRQDAGDAPELRHRGGEGADGGAQGPEVPRGQAPAGRGRQARQGVPRRAAGRSRELLQSRAHPARRGGRPRVASQGERRPAVRLPPRPRDCDGSAHLPRNRPLLQAAQQGMVRAEEQHRAQARGLRLLPRLRPHLSGRPVRRLVGSDAGDRGDAGVELRHLPHRAGQARGRLGGPDHRTALGRRRRGRRGAGLSDQGVPHQRPSGPGDPAADARRAAGQGARRGGGSCGAIPAARRRSGSESRRTGPHGDLPRGRRRRAADARL